jgi:hypothetical protein
VHNIVKTHELSCSPDILSLVCDACQRAKSHQLSYTASSRVSNVPLELIHSDVWGPTRVSSGGISIMLVLWMTTLVSVGFIFLNTNLMLNKFYMPFKPMWSVF